MKKAIACLLALPLALAACGAQTTQPAPTQAPEVTTKVTAESGETTPAGTSQTSPTGWLRHCVLEAGIWELDCDDGYYDVNRVWDESTATNTFTVLKTDRTEKGGGVPNAGLDRRDRPLGRYDRVLSGRRIHRGRRDTVFSLHRGCQHRRRGDPAAGGELPPDLVR